MLSGHTGVGTAKFQTYHVQSHWWLKLHSGRRYKTGTLVPETAA